MVDYSGRRSDDEYRGIWFWHRFVDDPPLTILLSEKDQHRAIVSIVRENLPARLSDANFR